MLPERPSRTLEHGAPTLAALQTLMWNSVGIVRDGQGLLETAKTLAAWSAHISSPSDRPSHELQHLLLVGRLVTEAALLREESRGAHYRTDFPNAKPEWLKHLAFRRPS